jgi:hypothetical protein
LQAPHTRRHHSDAQFLIDVYNGAKSWPSLIEIICIRAPARNI